MLTGFEKRIAGFAESEKLFGPVDKLLLAVSGGADSIALTYAMLALKAEGIFNGQLVCAHINHNLRGYESNRDQSFVIAQAGRLNLPVINKDIDVGGFAEKNKLSIETAARNLRIETLIDIAKANNCNRIDTGHHKNDNAETVLQRLSRGSGFRGLAGIWPMRRFGENISFIRPLLIVTRDEIVEYLTGRNLQWRTDRTNTDYSYRRNYIRHRLMPALQQDCRGSIIEQLFELSQSARRFYSLVCSCAENTWPKLADYNADKLKLDLNLFKRQQPAVKVELIRRSLAAIGSGERDLTQGHYERIVQLAQQGITGKRIELPGDFEVGCEYGKLIFAQTGERPELEDKPGESKQIEVPGRTRFGNYLIEAAVFETGKGGEERFKAGKNSFTECFDLDKVRLPLLLRTRQAGDRFVPLGLASEKRVSKFLTDQRVPQRIRSRVLIVADDEKIIWLWPIRMSGQAKVTDKSRKILQLQITDAALTDSV